MRASNKHGWVVDNWFPEGQGSAGDEEVQKGQCYTAVDQEAAIQNFPAHTKYLRTPDHCIWLAQVQYS